MLREQDIDDFVSEMDTDSQWLINVIGGREDWIVKSPAVEGITLSIGAALASDEAGERLGAVDTEVLAGFLAHTQVERFLIALRRIADVAPETLEHLSGLQDAPARIDEEGRNGERMDESSGLQSDDALAPGGEALPMSALNRPSRHVWWRTSLGRITALARGHIINEVFSPRQTQLVLKAVRDSVRPSTHDV